MTVLRRHVDEKTEEELRRFAAESGRTIEELAEAAIAEAALASRREREARVRQTAELDLG